MPFEESEMLAARLKVISSATILVPMDYYLENEGITETNPEFALSDDMMTLDSWSYRLPGILPFGCMYHEEHPFFSEYEMTPEQKEEVLEHLTNNFQILKAFRNANESSSTDTYETGKIIKKIWVNRMYGDPEVFEDDEESHPQFKGNKVIILKNNEWLGAMNYLGIHCKNHGFLYRGFGYKEGIGNVERKIKSIPKSNQNQRLYPEYPEPNPQNEESEKLETDSEDDDDFST
jgi:hypothetical protein